VDESIEAVRRARVRAFDATRAWIAARLPEAAANALAGIRGGARRGLVFAGTERTGLAGAAIVVVAGWALTRLLWEPLSWPSATINLLIARMTPTSCAAFGPPNVLSDNVCGTVLAILTVAGALTAMVALVLFRIPLRRLAMAIFGATFGPADFVAAPLTTTLLFGIGWAGVQYHFPGRPGIVPDGDFPAVVGLLTYTFVRYGSFARTHAAGVFDWGASIAAPARMGIVLLVPFAVSVLTLPVLHTPVRDQASVLAAMLAGYVLFSGGAGVAGRAPGEEARP
ncbi:MAG: hypothetical protein WD734_01635, partial [Dehalococcoidia bacterium]